MRVLADFRLVVFLISALCGSCISNQNSFESPLWSFSKEEEVPGFCLRVDYGKHTEMYQFSTDRIQMDLVDLLSELSLRENPPMRFISTLSTIEIYDVYGTRNNFENEWSLYVNGKKVSWERLKQGINVERDSEILLRYEKGYRVPTRKR